MPVTLATGAIEKGTFIVTAAFTDDDGAAVTPNNLTWHLTDKEETIINSRSSVVIAVPATSVDIVLSGDDLALDVGAGIERILTITGDYDSGAGSGLPLNDQAEFIIQPLVAVT